MNKNLNDSKFGLDYDVLETSVNKAEHKMYRLADVQNKIERVAFDIVRFRDDSPEKLWQIQSADDGDYIVALYEEEAAKKVASRGSDWSVVLGSMATDLHVFYKGSSVARLNPADLGIPASELNLVRRYLPAELAKNNVLVKGLLNRCDATVREELVSRFPELGKF